MLIYYCLYYTDCRYVECRHIYGVREDGANTRCCKKLQVNHEVKIFKEILVKKHSLLDGFSRQGMSDVN